MTTLPRTDLPVHSFTIPSSGQLIRFRPYTVKEKKLLMMALEANDDVSILEAVKQIIHNCIIDKDFDVSTLASFDLEYFFLQLRAKSVGEVQTAKISCTFENPETQEVCGNSVDVTYNINDTKVHKDETHTNKILLTPGVGLTMKYPSLDMVNDRPYSSAVDTMFDFILDCIDTIFDETTVTRTTEIDRAELVEFVDSLTEEQFGKIENFFKTMPSVRHEISATCKKCGHEHHVVLEGLTSFFG